MILPPNPRPCLLLWGACALLALCAGCGSWPLHANLPDPDPAESSTPSVSSVLEDANLASGAVQGLGVREAPSVLVVEGLAQSCGWDPDATWPEWPQHPLDADGDGVAEGQGPWHAGWYSGDVDLYSLRLAGGGGVRARLEWANAPAERNAPYQPGVPGPWEAESDLDVLLLSAGPDGPRSVLAEGGFTRASPEDSGAPVLIDDADTLILGVACHHAVASAYTLTVELLAR